MPLVRPYVKKGLRCSVRKGAYGRYVKCTKRKIANYSYVVDRPLFATVALRPKSTHHVICANINATNQKALPRVIKTGDYGAYKRWVAWAAIKLADRPHVPVVYDRQFTDVSAMYAALVSDQPPAPPRVQTLEGVNIEPANTPQRGNKRQFVREITPI